MGMLGRLGRGGFGRIIEGRRSGFLGRGGIDIGKGLGVGFCYHASNCRVD
jgi:hypothetical protein